MNDVVLKGSVALGVMAASAAAFAEVTPVNVADVVANISAAATPIGLIGAAVLIVMVGIKVFKWIQRAM